MEDTEYINIPSQSATKGSSTVVKLDFVSDKAAKTAVSEVDVTVTYDAAVLKTSADKISLSSTIKDDAKVSVNNGTVNIKIEKMDNAKTYVLGTCIAQITFEALRAAGSEIAVSGTLTQASPEKSVKLAQKESAQIVVTTYDGGSGSGSKGGKRSEGSGGNASIPVTDPTGGNNTADTSVFADLSSSHWAAKAVEYLNKQGIVKGYEDGTFRPDDSVTREEFVAMLVRAFANADSENTVDFKDADPNAWYYPYIVAAAQNGVVNGDGENFGVGRTITRQDMCAMLARIAKAFNVSLNGKYSTVIFDDESQIADYAKDSVKSLQISGVVNGIGNGLFDPTGSVSRAMAAKALYGLMMLR